MGYRTIVCDGCENPNPVSVVLRDELWLTIAPRPSDRRSSGILCFRCMEARLGRKLTLDDLKPCILRNEMIVGAIIGRQTDTPPESFSEDPAFHLENR